MTHVSIAMATYNGDKFVGDQLDSFANQTVLPTELVISDDCSSDGTIDVVRAFETRAPFPIHIAENKRRLGYTRNFERALSLCKGDIIFLSDQDDTWYPSKIDLITSRIEELMGKHVIVNDAQYTNENLVPQSTTVLQRVLEYSGRESDHIHGAATAITKRFRDFVLPFPVENCPAHDVYIHRWASLLATKVVSRDVLQTWRRHDANATLSSSEMSDPVGLSKIQLYRKYSGVDVSESYLKKARELGEMICIGQKRHQALSQLKTEISYAKVMSTLEDSREANEARARLSSLDWLERKKLIGKMIYKGQYKYFQGVKSIVKDLVL